MRASRPLLLGLLIACSSSHPPEQAVPSEQNAPLEHHSTTKGDPRLSNSQALPDHVYTSFGGDLFDEWDGTPEVDRAFRGIKLGGPEEVVISEGAPEAADGIFGPLVIAGTYVIDDDLPPEIGIPEDEIVLVVVDEDTNQIFSSSLADEAEPVDDPDEAEPILGVITQGYFNPNLFEFIPLPCKEASYVVYSTLGPYRSNSIRIRLKLDD